MTDLQRSHAELRGAVMLAGKEIRKLNFGRADSPVLAMLAARGPVTGHVESLLPRCAISGTASAVRPRPLGGRTRRVRSTRNVGSSDPVWRHSVFRARPAQWRKSARRASA